MTRVDVCRPDNRSVPRGGKAHRGNKWDRESPLGEEFRGLSEYLDQCCLMNSAGWEGCRMRRQCCNWWDKYCIGAYTDLTPAEVRELVARFEKARRRWMASSALGGEI